MTTEQIDRLERLQALRKDGVLTDDEFNAEKAKLLGGGATTTPVAAPAPVSSASAQYKWTPFRIALALVGVPALALLILKTVNGGAALTAMSGGPLPDHATLLPTPHGRIDKVDADDSCARLTDYCIRVSCTVTNDGNAAGPLEVQIILTPKGKAPYLATDSVTLSTGQSAVVTHDFAEASVTDGRPQAKCTVRAL